MAAIDKTYIHGKEYKVYRNWWIENYDKMKKELGDYIWMYPFSSLNLKFDEPVTPEILLTNNQDLEDYKNVTEFAIWNTSESTDKWLVKNCNIQSFRDRILDVYSYNWKGFKGQKWVPKPNYKPKTVK